MRRRLGFGLILLTSLLAAGCGGGSSGGASGGTLNDVPKTGTFSLGFSGGAAPGVKHAWLTVSKVAFNADANLPWDPTDSSWKVVTFTTPVTVDIAAAGGFLVGNSSAGVTVPVGTYNQIRLFLVPHDDTSGTMPTVADTSTTSKGLTYKAQLDYEAGGSVPIEIPNIQSGLRLDRGVIVQANTWSVLTSHIDVDRSIVRFNGDGAVDAVTWRPRPYTYGFSPTTTGTIQGAIDPTYVCGSVGARSDCATDIMVSLHAASRDGGTRMENWGSVKVNPTKLNTSGATVNDGTFELGPVSATSTDGNPTSYDLVIRGTGMKTMVVKDISYGLFSNYVGCSWSLEAKDDADASTLIRPVPDASPRTVSLSPSLVLKTGRVGLGFTLPGRTLPYEVHAANTDPFSGLLTTAAALSVPSTASGDVQVASYAAIKSTCTGHTPPADLAIPFASMTPSEGAGAFTPFALGTLYTDAKLASSPYSSGATFAVEEPTAVSGSTTGTVDVSITGLNGSGATKAQLIVSDVGGIVKTQDVASCISTSGTCTVSALALPAGTAANGAATAVYEFAVRYWNGANTSTAKSAMDSGGTMKWARASSFVNLRSATSGTVAITVP